nr:autophagy-related protein 18b [Quercus suber]
MANQSSSSSSSSSTYPILCASFNQDASCFVIGTRDGFKVFDTNTGRLCYERGEFSNQYFYMVSKSTSLYVY